MHSDVVVHGVLSGSARTSTQKHCHSNAAVCVLCVLVRSKDETVAYFPLRVIRLYSHKRCTVQREDQIQWRKGVFRFATCLALGPTSVPAFLGGVCLDDNAAPLVSGAAAVGTSVVLVCCSSPSTP